MDQQMTTDNDVTPMDDTEHVEVRLHFDGHHGEGLEFIEAETADGESINLVEWDIGSGGSTLKFEVPERCVGPGADRDV